MYCICSWYSVVGHSASVMASLLTTTQLTDIEKGKDEK
jgi:hypothetical protein